jgi:hypothetical protein
MMRLNFVFLAIIISILFFPFVVSAKGKPINAALLKGADGEYVGRVIGMLTTSQPYVLTDQGYRTVIRIGNGMVIESAEVYFETIDCTGEMYVTSPKYLGSVFLPTSNMELAYTTGFLLYTPNDEQSKTISIKSTYDSNLNCQPFEDTREGYTAYQNVPITTGIKNTAYEARMLIE